MYLNKQIADTVTKTAEYKNNNCTLYSLYTLRGYLPNRNINDTRLTKIQHNALISRLC